ncbi:MAG: hypothetical protein ABIH23_24770 [bacterium]
MSSSQDCTWRGRVILAASGEEPITNELRNHVAECADCHRLYFDLQRLAELRIPTPPVPEEIHQRILRAAREESLARQRKPISLRAWFPRSIPRMAWAAIFLAAVGIGTWQYIRSESQITPLPTEEMDYGLAIVEMDLQVLESEIELSLLDMT